jgi:hypothetical protein
MLGCPPGIIHSPESFSLLGMGMPVMPSNMPEEAHCQEDRGINAETWYVFHFSMCICAMIVFCFIFHKLLYTVQKRINALPDLFSFNHQVARKSMLIN